METNVCYQGDCLDVMKGIDDKSIDLVLIDPPYGVELGKNSKAKYNNSNDLAEEVIPMVNKVLQECFRVSDLVVMTPGVKNMFSYPKPSHVGSFYYPAASGMNKWGFSCWQPIFFYGKDPYLAKRMGSRPDSFSSTERAEKNGHPCPKPIGQWEWLLKRISFEGQTVLDCFAGSGTTGVACKNLNRNFILIEQDEKYCDIIKERVGCEIIKEI